MSQNAKIVFAILAGLYAYDTFALIRIVKRFRNTLSVNEALVEANDKLIEFMQDDAKLRDYLMYLLNKHRDVIELDDFDVMALTALHVEFK